MIFLSCIHGHWPAVSPPTIRPRRIILYVKLRRPQSNPKSAILLCVKFLRPFWPAVWAALKRRLVRCADCAINAEYGIMSKDAPPMLFVIRVSEITLPVSRCSTILVPIAESDGSSVPTRKKRFASFSQTYSVQYNSFFNINIDQSIDYWSNQSINQSINQSRNQFVKLIIICSVCRRTSGDCVGEVGKFNVPEGQQRWRRWRRRHFLNYIGDNTIDMTTDAALSPVLTGSRCYAVLFHGLRQ